MAGLSAPLQLLLPSCKYPAGSALWEPLMTQTAAQPFGHYLQLFRRRNIHQVSVLKLLRFDHLRWMWNGKTSGPCLKKGQVGVRVGVLIATAAWTTPAVGLGSFLMMQK